MTTLPGLQEYATICVNWKKLANLSLIVNNIPVYSYCQYIHVCMVSKLVTVCILMCDCHATFAI